MKLNLILPVLTVIASSLAFAADSEITSDVGGGNLSQSQQIVGDELDGHWLSAGDQNDVTLSQRPTDKPKMINSCGEQSCNRRGFDETDNEGNTIIWVPADQEYKEGLESLGITYVGEEEDGWRRAKLCEGQRMQQRKCKNGTIRDIRVGKGKGATVAKIHHYYVTDNEGQKTSVMEAKIDFKTKNKVKKHLQEK